MGDLVNLRQARKAKARAGKEQAADRNRALHGQPKAEREREKRLLEQANRFIEGHRVERTDEAQSAGPRTGPVPPRGVR